MAREFSTNQSQSTAEFIFISELFTQICQTSQFFFGPQEVEEIQKSIHQQYESKIEETILRLKKTEQSKHHLENKVAELTKELAERKRMEARRSSQTRDSRHRSSYSRVTDGYSSDESRFVNF